MKTTKLYYATNRAHEGKNRWKPTGYGKKFSSDGHENLRFGELTVQVDATEVEKWTDKVVEPGRIGHGEKLTGYLKTPAKKAKITAYKDDTAKATKAIEFEKNSSVRMFRNLKLLMDKNTDVLIYIHGYNVNWDDAVASALALQFMLNSNKSEGDKDVVVFLFSWPSNGSMMPWAAYKSDRGDARDSGKSIGRGLLKMRDFLGILQRHTKDQKNKVCGSNIHLLCHSMGNYVLRNAVQSKLIGYNRGRMPRLFKHIFMCAADEDDDILEGTKPLSRLHELCTYVSVYHNSEDFALHLSDNTKGNPDRLGQSGCAHPALVHNKIHQVDCSPIVKGFTEHSYYLWASVNEDIKQSINDLPFNHDDRKRTLNGQNREWTMVQYEQ